MSSSVIISIIALILTALIAVSTTVLVSRALTNAFRTLDKMHERNGQHVAGLLDRLQAIRWEDFASLRALEEPQVGGFFTPEEQFEEPKGDGRWGHLNAVRDRFTDDEQQLLDEDFGNENR